MKWREINFSFELLSYDPESFVVITGIAKTVVLYSIVVCPFLQQLQILVLLLLLLMFSGETLLTTYSLWLFSYWVHKTFFSLIKAKQFYRNILQI